MKRKHVPNIGTLCFVFKKDQIVLGKKNYGKMSNKLVFPGGKLEYEDKGIFSSIKREVKEETGLHIENPKLISRIDFSYSDKNDTHFVYVFKTNQFNGSLIDTNELSNGWFEISKMPFKSMWDSDKFWFYSAFDKRQNIIKIYKNSSNNEVEKIDIEYCPIEIPVLKNKPTQQK